MTISWLRRAILGLATGLGLTGPAQAGAGDFYGELFLMAGPYCPQGALPADGAIHSQHDNEPMFSLIGQRFGALRAPRFRLPQVTEKAHPAAFPPTGLRWCIRSRAARWPDPEAEGEADSWPRLPGEVLVTAGEYCPAGWQRRSAVVLGWLRSDQGDQRIEMTHCVGGGGPGGAQDHETGRLVLVEGDSCPAGSVVPRGGEIGADGAEVLAWLLADSYGWAPEGRVMLPDLDSPAPGLSWCLIADGLFPARD